MRAALTAIEWPDDELQRVRDAQGIAVRDSRTKFCCAIGTRTAGCIRFDLPAESDAAFAPVVEALALLADLHRAAQPPSRSPPR